MQKNTPQLPLFPTPPDDFPPIVPITSKRIKDITGEKFSRLTVLGYVGKNRQSAPLWLVTCECGNKSVVIVYNLLKGNTTSCGCWHREQLAERNFRHGLSDSPEYDCWRAMNERCTNPAVSGYHMYGGKGIAVCKRWQDSPDDFIKDMGLRPGPEYSIDRIDNDLGYFPENCRWATPKEQANNRVTNRHLEFQGERLTMAQWARKIGMVKGTLIDRLKRGWSIERTLTVPVDPVISQARRKSR